MDCMRKIKKVILGLLLCCLVLSACGDRQPTVTMTDAVTAKTEDTLTPLTIDTEFSVIPTDTATRIHVVAVGDNIGHDSVDATAAALASGDKKYDFTEIYAGVAELVSAADIAFVNQEAPVGGEELGISGYPNFNAPREAVEGLMRTGFNVFNIANNHMLDKGEKGYVNTIAYFNTLPVTMIGGYTASDYDNIRIVESKGVRIAFLSYTTLVNSGHIHDLPASSTYIIPYANANDIRRQVALAKESADVVIASFHWGTENAFTQTTEQTRYAKLCADLGVDVVLGHHSHVVGDVEYLTGESGNRTLVAYSLGNFCGTMLNIRNNVGLMLVFDIVRDADGIITVENAVVEPTVSHYKTDTAKTDRQGLAVRYDSRVYLLRDYTERLATEHGAHNWDSFTFDGIKKLVTDHVSAEFLPDFLQS